MADRGLSETYKNFLPYLCRCLSPFHVVSFTSSFPSHSATGSVKEAGMGVRGGIVIFSLDIRAQSKQVEQNGGEEMGWSGCVWNGQGENLRMRSQS